MDLRVMSLWQPYATLLADPDLPKTIETRPRPWPSTIPLPAWVLIHAAAKRPKESIVGSYYTHDTAGMFLVDRGIPLDRRPLPLGAVIGAAHVTACLPIIDETLGWWGDSDTPDDCLLLPLFGPEMVRPDIAVDDDLSHEVPYGHYEHRRFGYLTGRTVLLPEPIPWKGAQWPSQRATPDLIAAVAAQGIDIA